MAAETVAATEAGLASVAAIEVADRTVIDDRTLRPLPHLHRTRMTATILPRLASVRAVRPSPQPLLPDYGRGGFFYARCLNLYCPGGILPKIPAL